MKIKFYSFLSFFALTMAMLITSCANNNQETAEEAITSESSSVVTFDIRNLSDQEYPDNPDIGFRSKNYQTDLFDKGVLSLEEEPFQWNFTFNTKTGDSIKLEKVLLKELIPTIPEHVKNDEYLSYIACINQEWNRNQIRFNKGEFSSSIPSMVRVDLARNCLNAYLWEIIVYIEEDSTTVPYSHGWFDFPHDQYASLFESKNKIPFAQYKKPLENWVDPENNAVDLSLLRNITAPINVEYKDLSDQMYPVAAARKKKFKEIIYPTQFETMRDLQSDSSLFATFTPPGFYNRQDPRTTELGRLVKLTNVEVNKVKTPNSESELHEIRLNFEHGDSDKKTSLLFGGLDLNEIPVLEENNANKGWKSSMGIGNHTFYETYDKHIHSSASKSNYYALILDGDGNWLDSHKIGIDGPIMHFTDEARTNLHVWLLSFERHALVGHYEIQIK